MSVNNKRVFYVKYLAHEIYADILRARADVRLDRLENESADEVSAPILAAAHVYQIGAETSSGLSFSSRSSRTSGRARSMST